MPDVELLGVLGNCLKGTRARVYENEMKIVHRTELDLSEPRKIYDAIKVKMMRFREADEEKGTRVMQEHTELTKGKMTAEQFETVWANIMSTLSRSWSWSG